MQGVTSSCHDGSNASDNQRFVASTLICVDTGSVSGSYDFATSIHMKEGITNDVNEHSTTTLNASYYKWTYRGATKATAF